MRKSILKKLNISSQIQKTEIWFALPYLFLPGSAYLTQYFQDFIPFQLYRVQNSDSKCIYD